MMPSYVLMAALQAASPQAPRCAERIRAMEAYRELDEQFPRSLEIRDHACGTIEFCPDNTCDVFVARRSGSPQELMEFAYVYVYGFSEYHVLEPWRARPAARDVMSRILASERYRACRRADEREAARCVLRMLAEQRDIRLADVRYDESARHETPKNVP